LWRSGLLLKIPNAHSVTNIDLQLFLLALPLAYLSDMVSCDRLGFFANAIEPVVIAILMLQKSSRISSETCYREFL